MSVPSSESDEWIEMLHPVGTVLADPLERRFQDRSPEREAERPLAALALADYLQGNSRHLVDLVVLADSDREFQPLVAGLRNHRQSVVAELQARLGQALPGDAQPAERDALKAEQKAILKKWVDEGAKWGTSPIDRFAFTTDSRAGRDWWSLQPLGASEQNVPGLEQDGHVRRRKSPVSAADR